MIIAYLAFGKDISNFQQAVFSILTILPKLNEEEKIVVITDSPDNFNLLITQITIIEVDNLTLKEWKGPYDFFWRTKIKALQFVSEKWKNKSILYLDSDTFLFGTLEGIRLNLSKGVNVMHTNEGKLSEIFSKTQSLMWKQLRGKCFGNIEIDSDKCMWNAGVVGVSYKKLEQIELALIMCDEMCEARVIPTYIEQFALSVAMNQPNVLVEAQKEIGHYWGNKTMWNAMIQELFSSALMNNLSIQQLIEQVAKVDFEKIPIKAKSNKTKRRLERQLSRFFSHEKKTYISMDTKA